MQSEQYACFLHVSVTSLPGTTNTLLLSTVLADKQSDKFQLKQSQTTNKLNEAHLCYVYCGKDDTLLTIIVSPPLVT